MQIIFYYNPKNNNQNKGINLSPEYNFLITCEKEATGNRYILSEINDNCRSDIYTDDKIVSVGS